MLMKIVKEKPCKHIFFLRLAGKKNKIVVKLVELVKEGDYFAKQRYSEHVSAHATKWST